MHLYISMRSRKKHGLFSGPKQRKTYQRNVRFIFRSQNPQRVRLFGFYWYVPRIHHLYGSKPPHGTHRGLSSFATSKSLPLRGPCTIQCEGSIICDLAELRLLAAPKKDQAICVPPNLEHFSNANVTFFWRHRGTVWLEQRPRPPTFMSRDNCDTFSTTNVSAPGFGMVRQDHAPQFQAEANHPIE